MLEQIEKTIYKVAIYIRLSKEDVDRGYDESESIKNQRTLLTEYVQKLGWKYQLIDTYIDQGFTGTNFNRPDFQRMIKDIENGKINMVVTKDLSRLGRDYIETGEYIEKWFPENNVRYVSVTDKIDTFEYVFIFTSLHSVYKIISRKPLYRAKNLFFCFGAFVAFAVGLLMLRSAAFRLCRRRCRLTDFAPAYSVKVVPKIQYRFLVLAPVNIIAHGVIRARHNKHTLW